YLVQNTGYHQSLVLGHVTITVGGANPLGHEVQLPLSLHCEVSSLDASMGDAPIIDALLFSATNIFTNHDLFPSTSLAQNISSGGLGDPITLLTEGMLMLKVLHRT
ncbi:hypothetical protein HAX54_039121, partial [Datura stramonium]|nr:hypothetical protein [Datura stramonium]